MVVKVHVNLGDIDGKVNKAAEFGRYALTQQVLKDSNYYAPEDTKHMIDTSVNEVNTKQGKIIWDTDYARRLYYNPQFNFSKDMNPHARGRWFDAAKAEHGYEWPDVAKKAVNKYIDEH